MQLILSLKDWVQRENKYLVCCFRPSVKIPCLVLSSSRGRHVFLGVIHAKKKPRQLVGGAHWPDCKSEVREQGDNFQPRKNRRMKPFRTFDKFNVVSEERSRGWLMFPCDTIGGVRPLNLAITPEPAPARISVNGILNAFNFQIRANWLRTTVFSKMSCLHNLHGTAKCFVRRLSSDLPSNTTSMTKFPSLFNAGHHATSKIWQ
jgi:hypothetical protein